jgi:hypothetical protein
MHALCPICNTFLEVVGRDVHALLELAHMREEHDAWHKAGGVR